jgi:hypothetical protein
VSRWRQTCEQYDRADYRQIGIYFGPGRSLRQQLVCGSSPPVFHAVKSPVGMAVMIVRTYLQAGLDGWVLHRRWLALRRAATPFLR